MDRATGLTARQVAHTVQAVLDLDSPPGVRPIEEGGEHLSWLVDARYVVRFALDAETSERQCREIAVRDLVRGRVGVPVPRSVVIGTWGRGGKFTVDEWLPGTSGELRSVGAVGEGDLAALLSGLRSVPRSEAMALGVPVDSPRPLAELGEHAATAAERLVLNGQRGDSYAVHLRNAPVRSEEVSEHSLVHADLKGEHLLVSGDGAISGVLDWTAATIGDPAIDVAGLAISVGAAAAVRAAQRAGYAGARCARGVHLARCDTLIRLDELLNGTDDSPEPLLRRQLARAWEVTSLDSGDRESDVD